MIRLCRVMMIHKRGGHNPVGKRKYSQKREQWVPESRTKSEPRTYVLRRASRFVWLYQREKYEEEERR